MKGGNYSRQGWQRDYATRRADRGRAEEANVATGSGSLESLGRALVAGSLQDRHIGIAKETHTHWTEEVDPGKNTPRGQSSTLSEVLDFRESKERGRAGHRRKGSDRQVMTDATNKDARTLHLKFERHTDRRTHADTHSFQRRLAGRLRVFTSAARESLNGKYKRLRRHCGAPAIRFIFLRFNPFLSVVSPVSSLRIRQIP